MAEPAARNTGPAVGLGALVAARRAGDDVRLAVIPSDAFIADEAEYGRVLGVALEHAAEAIVTIGIKPTRPETGYGYLQRGAPGARRRLRGGPFRGEARRGHGRALPGGRRLPRGTRACSSSPRGGCSPRRARTCPSWRPFSPRSARAPIPPPPRTRAIPAAPKISIDYGIMEKASGIRVVPGDFGWNDVGSWSALADIRPQDAAGNVTIGDVILREVSGSVVVSEPGAPLVGVVGVQDLVVVATQDAVLVVKKDRAQEVRAVVDALAAAKRNELL